MKVKKIRKTLEGAFRHLPMFRRIVCREEVRVVDYGKPVEDMIEMVTELCYAGLTDVEGCNPNTVRKAATSFCLRRLGWE